MPPKLVLGMIPRRGIALWRDRGCTVRFLWKEKDVRSRPADIDVKHKSGFFSAGCWSCWGLVADWYGCSMADRRLSLPWPACLGRLGSLDCFGWSWPC